MARGKFQKKTTIRPLVWILLAVIALSSTTGGVKAWLSMSADSDTAFTVAADPTVSVSGSVITVNNPQCDVILRVAVSANKVDASGNVIAGQTVEFNTPDGWTQRGSYYVYNSTISAGSSTTVTFPLADSDGVVVSIAAQVIQAEGTVDGGTQTPSEASW